MKFINYNVNIETRKGLMKICRNLSLSKELIMTSCRLLLRKDTIKGENIAAFEDAFRTYLGVDHAIATSSGRYAFYLILKSLPIKKGDEILLPAYMPWVIAKVALIAGLTPVFVDIDPKTCNIDPADIERKITQNTRYLLVVHLHGVPCDMSAIERLATKHRLIIIEDCAQALGSTYNGHKLGSFGIASFFSFGLYKHPTTFGGGMIATNNPDLAVAIHAKISNLAYPTRLELTKRLILGTMKYTWNSPPIVTCIGYPLMSCLPQQHKDAMLKRIMMPPEHPHNIDIFTEDTLNNENAYRYTNFQATLGLQQLKTHDQHLQKQAHIVQTLHRYLKPTIQSTTIVPSATYSCCHTTNQQETVKTLFNAGIIPWRGYYHSLPDLHAFHSYASSCPHASHLRTSLIYLPVQPHLREKDLEHVAYNLQHHHSL